MKSKVSRVTVSLPTTLLEAADGELAEEDESRSSMIRRLIEAALKEAKERKDVERYVRAYTEQPQTEEEIGWITDVGARQLGEIPW